MRSTLALLLTGPLQSWGERSHFDHRDTLTHPTRSGIIGLLASARGDSREADLSWAQPLEITVRIDRAGARLEDFHTIGGAGETILTAQGKQRTTPAITRRHYLADAAFLVLITGPRNDITTLSEQVRSPRWAPYLGRRGCPPSLPIHLGVSTRAPDSLLSTTPLYRTPPREDATITVTVVSDSNLAGSSGRLRDVPVSFDPHQRSYDTRDIAATSVEMNAQQCAGVGFHPYTSLIKAIRDDY
ncbi:type I-E CRISPR-associated protein Cas5/CasD [Allokutzneria sp. NRRL B-24872]|uniref:type I-E CRISPR-associated protein Cas5/CasD n=1 Tax=Allokutzneria sp. NRRL B-24872 TaxID=1137961 RepID=UPI000A3B4307|nr:type I-E CRISPR-associated protein Cas5/CasD [Allokutzneria sp. NRRL B-24872]